MQRSRAVEYLPALLTQYAEAVVVSYITHKCLLWQYARRGIVTGWIAVDMSLTTLFLYSVRGCSCRNSKVRYRPKCAKTHVQGKFNLFLGTGTTPHSRLHPSEREDPSFPLSILSWLLDSIYYPPTLFTLDDAHVGLRSCTCVLYYGRPM